VYNSSLSNLFIGKIMENFFAAFVLCVTNGGFAATTRAADRGEFGRIGLPGGKVDSGESAKEAAVRESAEEGWMVFGISDVPFHTALVDGKPVAWFTADGAIALEKYKEEGRIAPVVASLEEIRICGYGNDFAVESYLRIA
jgi:hypothetical protein